MLSFDVSSRLVSYPPALSEASSAEDRVATHTTTTKGAIVSAMLADGHVIRKQQEQQQQQQHQHPQLSASGSCHYWPSVNDSSYSSGNINTAATAHDSTAFGYYHRQQFLPTHDPFYSTGYALHPTPPKNDQAFVHPAQVRRSSSNVTDEHKLSGSNQAPTSGYANPHGGKASGGSVPMDAACRFDAQRARLVESRNFTVTLFDVCRQISIFYLMKFRILSMEKKLIDLFCRHQNPFLTCT